MISECDVIVVGGGPGGSSCARALAQQGARVTLLDRATFPRDKLCTGWITPPVIDALALDLDEYRRGRVLQPFHGFRTAGLSPPATVGLAHRPRRLEFGRAISYGIRRAEFDTYLLRRCGARVIEGATVRSVSRSHGRWVVDSRWSAPILVGAGGHFCPVARAINGHREPEVVVARDVEVPTEQAVEPGVVSEGVPELYFCADMAGYGWVVIKQQVVSIGLGRQDTAALDAHANHFVQVLKALGRLRADFTPKWRGHAYLLARASTRRATAGGLVLVGDAAGLAAMGSGEGIRAAVESGQAAARAIGQCDGDYSHERLDTYARALTTRYGHRGAVAIGMRAEEPRLLGGLTARLARHLAGHVTLSSTWLSYRAMKALFLGESGSGTFATSSRRA